MMTHKERAKRYFKDEYLKNHHYLDAGAENRIDKMFHHLFEAVKNEIMEDLIVSSPELLTHGRIVDGR
jgi:hypothetical protein